MKLIACLALIYISSGCFAQNAATGAWIKKRGSEETVIIINPGYFTVSTYNVLKAKFIKSWGGTCSLDVDRLHAVIEFSTDSTVKPGTNKKYALNINDNNLTTDIAGRDLSYERVDSGKSASSGTWVIDSGKENDSSKTLVSLLSKTIKIVSDFRFQWIKINKVDGSVITTTGGNCYFDGGSYTEHIAFDASDSSRVGKTQIFRDYISGSTWKHNGKDAYGNTINELWTKLP